MSKESTKRQLPTVNELYGEKVVLAQQNDLNQILNTEPKSDWVKDHPIAKKVKYIPIERIEWLLTNIYVKWSVEILREGIMANSAYVAVRLHYRDPITGEPEYQDGLGAAPLQTDQGAGASDWNKIKNDAVMKALPAAESYAVKDAAEKLGKMFGKDLNRADKIMYDTLQGKFESELDLKTKQVIELIDKQKSTEIKNHERETLRKKRESGELTLEYLDEKISQLGGK